MTAEQLLAPILGKNIMVDLWVLQSWLFGQAGYQVHSSDNNSLLGRKT